MTDPISDVQYRIKSVDFQTYLEIPNPMSTDVRLRPAKETDSQFWQFEKIPNSTCYFVRNVSVNDRYLFLRTGKVSSDTTTIANAVVNVSYQDGAYQLAFYYKGSNYYFHTSDDDISLVRVTPISKNLGSQKWQLVPTAQLIFKDPLESGIYRIRNLNGKSLFTMPDGASVGSANVYVRSQVDQSPGQLWTVTRQDSGQYTIQNASNNSYLGSSPTPIVGGGVVGMQTTYLWHIQSVGGCAWSLHIPEKNISIGIVDNEIEDGNEVNLVYTDTTSTQMWFMEKSDSIGKVQPSGQNKLYAAKREVLEGKYLLRNAIYNSKHEPIYMNVSVSQSTSWITPGAAATFPFELKYVDEKSARFKLTYVETKSALIVADLGDYIGLTSDTAQGSEFVFLEMKEGDPGYVICRPDSDRPPKVVSGRAHARDDTQKPVFSVDNKVAGNALQMWMFVPIANE